MLLRTTVAANYTPKKTASSQVNETLIKSYVNQAEEKWVEVEGGKWRMFELFKSFFNQILERLRYKIS